MAVPQPFSCPSALQTVDHAGMIFPGDSEMFQAWPWFLAGGVQGDQPYPPLPEQNTPICGAQKGRIQTDLL